MPKIWCRLKKTIIEGVEAAQIFDRLLIKSLLQFYEAMSLSLHSAPLLLKVLIQIRSSLENVWIGAKLCRSFGGTRIHCIDGSCWSISSFHVNCIENRFNGFHNKCKWSFPRHLPNPHNGNRFPPIAHNDETDGLLRTLINAEKNIYWFWLLILDGLNMRPRWSIYRDSVFQRKWIYRSTWRMA